MPSCLVFRNDAPVMDLKIKSDSSELYFANIITNEKEAYQVHEYVKVDPATNKKAAYQIAYNIEPSNREIEQAIIELKAVPIE